MKSLTIAAIALLQLRRNRHLMAIILYKPVEEWTKQCQLEPSFIVEIVESLQSRTQTYSIHAGSP